MITYRAKRQHTTTTAYKDKRWHTMPQSGTYHRHLTQRGAIVAFS